MLPTLFEQFAVSVTGCVSNGDEGFALIEEQPNVPAEVWQVSVLDEELHATVPEQPKPLRVIV
jgi:hypothetical protein